MKALTTLAAGLLLVVAPALGASQAVTHQQRDFLAAFDHSQRSRSDLLESPAKLSLRRASIVDALSSLQKSSGVPIAYSETLLPRHRFVTCDCEDVSVREALGEILEGTLFDYTVAANQVVVRQRPIPTDVTPPAVLVQGLPMTAGLGEQRLRAWDRLQPQVVGIITGMVQDQATGQPLSAAQVYISGLDIGALTQQNGRYILLNVPAGTHTVTAERIGYRIATATVTVGDDETVAHDFALAEQALQLDEVIVTGTPGGTRQRAIGNVVGRIDAAAVTQATAVTNMQQLLGPREPGLNFIRGSGNVGTGSTIRIRGLASLGLNSMPLIFVDGIRVDNSTDAGPDLRDARQVSTLDDLAPGEIESIEVIKGPAAATLYGTEASAGVIQIITKKGQSGAPQFDIGITGGVNWLHDVNHWVGTAYARNDRSVPGLRLYEREKSLGNEWLQYGPIQTYSGSMRGGTDNIRYFISAEYQDHEGIVDYNWKHQTNLRGNLSIVPSEEYTIDVSMGYVKGLTSFMQQKNPYGFWDGLIWANAAGVDTRIRGFLRARPEKIAEMEATRDVSRVTASATLTHRPTEWLTNRAIVGTDWMDEFNSILVPRYPEGLDSEFGQLALGDLQIDNPVRQNLTLDLASSANYTVPGLESFNFTSSIGAQYYTRSEHVTSSHGQIFPAPQIRTIGGAAQKNAGQTFVENKSLGVYVQQELGWNDRVFLTAAVRGDDNSAFGADFEAAIYPKFSATWVISEEPFWNFEAINSLRFRSAWGKAGRQPDTFAAVTLYAPSVGPGGDPAITSNVLGNPDLGPEVSQELELGFDAAIFDDRASFEFTYYTQKVTDALLTRPVNPVTGFSGSQSVNAGQLSNWGWEISSRVRALDLDGFDWDLGVTWSMNDNEVDDLGPLLPTNDLREGRPFPFFSRRQVVEVGYTTEDGSTGVWPNNVPDDDAFVSSIQYALCDGGAGFDGYSTGGDPVPCADAPALQIGNGRVTPKYEASFNTTLTVGQNLRIYAMAEWRGEHWASSIGLSCRYLCGSGRYLNTFRPARWADALVAVYGTAGGTVGYNTPNTAFAMLREVSVNYTLPNTWVERFGASRASINVAARNPWMIWQANRLLYDVPVEPEGRDGAGYGAGGNPLSQNRLALPALTSLTVSTRVSF